MDYLDKIYKVNILPRNSRPKSGSKAMTTTPNRRRKLNHTTSDVQQKQPLSQTMQQFPQQQNLTAQQKKLVQAQHHRALSLEPKLSSSGAHQESEERKENNKMS